MTVAFFVSMLSFREAGGRPLLFYREECNFQFRESVHTVHSVSIIILGERKSSSRFIGPEDRLRQRAQSVHSLSCLANILSIPDILVRNLKSHSGRGPVQWPNLCVNIPRATLPL